MEHMEHLTAMGFNTAGVLLATSGSSDRLIVSNSFQKIKKRLDKQFTP